MFRKFAVAVAVVVSCFFVTGCYTLTVSAPANSNIKLAPTGQQMQFKNSHRNWYLIGGLVPLMNAEDGVANAIRNHNLYEVRVETKMTFVDALITYISLSIVTSSTTTIEGNIMNNPQQQQYMPPQQWQQPPPQQQQYMPPPNWQQQQYQQAPPSSE
jgi:hypothetical protein